MNKNSSLGLKITSLAAVLILLAGVIGWVGDRTAAQVGFNTGKTDIKAAENEIFARFDVWVEKYLSGEHAADADFIRAGEELAARRREAFKELIQNDPRAAIGKAVSGKVKNRLPAGVKKLLEKSVSARGDFHVTAFDDFDAAAENYRIEREAVIGEARYKAFVYGKKSAMTTKLDTALRGVVLDDLLAVHENSVEKIETDDYAERGVEAAKLENGVAAQAGGVIEYFANEAEFETFVREQEEWESKPAPQRSALSPWTEGQKNLLFIRVDFPDRPGVPVDRFGQVLTEEFSQNLIAGPVNEFFVNNSYQKTSLRVTITPVVRMPLPQSAYPQNNLSGLVNDARTAAFAAGFNTNDYQLDMVAFSQSPLLAWSGISPLANKGALINGNFTFKVVAHELGHAYGLLHANLWRTTDGTASGAGGNVEYGDDFDMMGRGSTLATHFNANYKRSLDWLRAENVQAVARPGVYRLYAHDTTAPQPAGVRALRIRRDGEKDLWIEFRQLLTNFPNLANGVTIRWDLPYDITRLTQILDMNPRTQSLDDAALTVGQTFSDEASGIRITVLGFGNTTPESLDIKVDINYSVNKGAAFDFDGDNRSDIGVFRPSSAVWYLNNSAGGTSISRFGLETDRIAPAKFDADRKTDVAIFRDGTWYLQNSSGWIFSTQFGLAGDIPVAADYDGDTFAELAVFRPSNGTWYMWNWVFQRFSAVQFGLSEDIPAPADFDGDGKTDVAVFRPSNGTWYLLQTTDGFGAVQFGLAGDKPASGDFDGDGLADVAVYRPSNGTWYLLQSAAGFGAVNWGVATDIPAPADYDGDGKTDLTVYRPAEGNWYRLNSSNGAFTVTNFGLNGDVPVSKGSGL